MNWKLLTAAAVISLVLSGGAFAMQGKATAKSMSATPTPRIPTQAASAKAGTSSKTATHQASGTVVSSDANTLVISHRFRGKAENMTFALNPETKTRGKLEASARVTIKYRVEGNENVALDVQARSPQHIKTANTNS